MGDWILERQPGGGGGGVVGGCLLSPIGFIMEQLTAYRNVGIYLPQVS